MSGIGAISLILGLLIVQAWLSKVEELETRVLSFFCNPTRDHYYKTIPTLKYKILKKVEFYGLSVLFFIHLFLQIKSEPHC
jgi:fumarate reductase subunit D